MGQYRRSLGELNAFKALSFAEKQAQTVELTLSDDHQYHFFIDNPRHQPAPRLNIVGHGDKGGQTFQGDVPGARLLTPVQLAERLRYQIIRTGARCIRLVSCRSGTTGFAQALANELHLPVKAPIGTVMLYEVMQGRFWILKKSANMRRPEEHLYLWYLPGVVVE
ncbi:hypothetical protein [Serratia sp. SRS-8-S-2018]|uniref:hypothetical protein n=1 Tax=Serratia sp. SRS-8-S-2018 TaxID=2591107 RepID=UPI0015E83BBD|nr:hypothetical protein [Serratia sp. SRS-8-S-2018]